MEVFRAELDMGAFELLTCSPVKVIMCAVIICFINFHGIIYISFQYIVSYSIQ